MLPLLRFRPRDASSDLDLPCGDGASGAQERRRSLLLSQRLSASLSVSLALLLKGTQDLKIYSHADSQILSLTLKTSIIVPLMLALSMILKTKISLTHSLILSLLSLSTHSVLSHTLYTLCLFVSPSV